jgi:hypothetical protein
MPPANLPEFDDVLTTVGSHFKMPHPRQNHTINTLAQISPTANLLALAGNLANIDPAGVPGTMKGLFDEAIAYRVHAAAVVTFVAKVALAMNVPVPPELTAVPHTDDMHAPRFGEKHEE